MKLFLSHPMTGYTEEEILKVRSDAFEWAKENISPDVELIDSYLDLGDVSPLIYISKSIELLADADVILALPGWENSRGCKIEMECAILYGKRNIIFK